MSSLREDLQSEDPLRQAAALLQLLNAMAGGRDVGTAVTIACQTVVRGSATPAVKRLAYSVVRGASLTDSDWENVAQGFKSDISASNPSVEVQVAALEVGPSIPPHKLGSLLAADDLTTKVLQSLASSVKEVRAAATVAVGRWLSDVACAAEFAASPELVAGAGKWAELAGDALLDSSNMASAAAFDAIRRMLSKTEVEKLEPGGTLRQKLAMQLSQRLLGALPAVLHRGRSLPPEGQVNVAGVLVAMVEFCVQQPVFPTAFTPSSSTALAQWTGDELAGAVAAPSAPRQGGAWVVSQIGDYLQSLLSSVSAPLAFEAAHGLLKICALVSKTSQPGASLAPASAWAPQAMAALVRLWDRETSSHSAASHPQLLSVITSHIRTLQALGQVQLARELFPMVAAVPSAAARTNALAYIWGAVVGLDLKTRSGQRTGGKGPAATELRNTLTEPFVIDVISATAADKPDSPAASASYPAFREELVCVLLDTMIAHPWAVVGGLEPPPEAREDDGNLGAVVKAAARAQRAGELIDWLGSAKIVLQGTKACLGWDRDPVGGTYASTVVTDSWLVLLQRALHASRALQSAPSGPTDIPAVISAARLASSYVGALQELLDQLLTHWQALSAAVQPRALWVAAHHFELAPSMDPGWAHLLQALSTSLGVQDDDAKMRRRQSLRAAAVAGCMQPYAVDEDGAYAVPVDEAEIRGEAIAVALVAADRLSSLLLHNARVGPQPGLKDIAASLAAALQPLAAPNSTAGPQSRERAARIVAYLTPLATAPAPSPEAGAAIAVQTQFGAKLLAAPDWPLNEGFPMAGPCSSTLQATKRGARYWALRTQVQTAIAAAAGKKPAEIEDTRPPDAVGVLEVMALISSADGHGGGTELTGPNDPLRLTAWHKLDQQASLVTMQFEAYNQLSFEVKDVTIRLGLGGPMVPEAKQPPAYKLAVLPPGESVTWRFSLRITAFGRISVQPFVSLPVVVRTIPGDNPSLRCALYTVPLTALLARPQALPAPDVFFQHWASLAVGAQLLGICRNGGAVGGLSALSSLEGGPLVRVHLQPLPAQGGFHAAYSGKLWDGTKIGLVITAQLLPVGPPPQILTSGTSPPLGRVVCRMTLRSSNAQAVAAVSADPATFIQELFGQTMAEGLDAEALSPVAAPFKVHASLAPLERMYAAPRLEEPDEDAPADALANGHAKKDVEAAKEADLDDATVREWQRVRLQRLRVAA